MAQQSKRRRKAQRPRRTTSTSDVSRGDKRIEDAASPGREGPKESPGRPGSLEVYDREHYGTQALPPTLVQQVDGSEEEGGALTAEALGREYLETEAQKPSKRQQTQRAGTRAAAPTREDDARPRQTDSNDKELSDTLDGSSGSSGPVLADADRHYASHTESEVRQVRER